MSSAFILASTGESQVFCHKDVLDLPIPAETTDFRGDLKPIVDQWTPFYAATEEKHDEAAFAEDQGGYRLTLDGRPANTPARKLGRVK